MTRPSAARTGAGSDRDIVSDLVDLADASLAALPSYDEQALAAAMGRVLRRADDPASLNNGYNPQRLD